MLVETFNDGNCLMTFNATDGTYVKMHAKGHYIDLNFIDKDGNEFNFKSDGQEFTIPGLVLDMTGNKLVVSPATVDGDSDSSGRRRMASNSHDEPDAPAASTTTSSND
jgi:hypothetical protein